MRYMFRVVSPPIIRSTQLSTPSCTCQTVTATCRCRGGVGGVSSSISSTIAAGKQVPDTVDTVVCAFDDGWRYHPKRVEQFLDINKLCNVASCRIIYWNIVKYLYSLLFGLRYTQKKT